MQGTRGGSEELNETENAMTENIEKVSIFRATKLNLTSAAFASDFQYWYTTVKNLLNQTILT
jgi:hypothetical protein